jgi:hypothetical protein
VKKIARNYVQPLFKKIHSWRFPWKKICNFQKLANKTIKNSPNLITLSVCRLHMSSKDFLRLLPMLPTVLRQNVDSQFSNRQNADLQIATTKISHHLLAYPN